MALWFTLSGAVFVICAGLVLFPGFMPPTRAVWVLLMVEHGFTLNRVILLAILRPLVAYIPPVMAKYAQCVIAWAVVVINGYIGVGSRVWPVVVIIVINSVVFTQLNVKTWLHYAHVGREERHSEHGVPEAVEKDMTNEGVEIDDDV